MASTPLCLFTFRPVTHPIHDALTPTYQGSYQHLLPFSNKNTIKNLTKLLNNFSFKLESSLFIQCYFAF